MYILISSINIAKNIRSAKPKEKYIHHLQWFTYMVYLEGPSYFTRGYSFTLDILIELQIITCILYILIKLFLYDTSPH